MRSKNNVKDGALGSLGSGSVSPKALLHVPGGQLYLSLLQNSCSAALVFVRRPGYY